MYVKKILRKTLRKMEAREDRGAGRRKQARRGEAISGSGSAGEAHGPQSRCDVCSGLAHAHQPVING